MSAFLGIVLAAIIFLIIFKVNADSTTISPIMVYDRYGNLLYDSQNSYKRAPSAVDHILNLVQEGYNENILSRGLVVHSTIDLRLQNHVQQILLDWSISDKRNIAVLISNPYDNTVITLINASDYFDQGSKKYAMAEARNLNIIKEIYDMNKQPIYKKSFVLDINKLDLKNRFEVKLLADGQEDKDLETQISNDIESEVILWQEENK